MKSISPALAAVLADEVYTVRNDFELKAFLARREFSGKGEHQQVLSAQVGGRIIFTNNSFAVCAVGAHEHSQHLFLMFRGTTGDNHGADYLTDIRAGLTLSPTGSLVHAGFSQAFSSMVPALTDFVRAQRSVRVVHCIGHSLGGAVANLAADWVSRHLQLPARLYTFGAPRVGLGVAGFANQLTTGLQPENIHRVYHSSDPVPMVPVFPFCHAPTSGMACYVPFGGGILSFAAHSMEHYIASVRGRPWSALRRMEPRWSRAAIDQWLRRDTAENPASITFWQQLHYAFAYLMQAVLAVTVAPAAVAGMTVADFLALILHRGLRLTGELADRARLLVRKLLRFLGRAVPTLPEALSRAQLQQILQQVLQRIHRQVLRALQVLG